MCRIEQFGLMGKVTEHGLANLIPHFHRIISEKRVQHDGHASVRRMTIKTARFPVYCDMFLQVGFVDRI
ncbi:hypothetical protein D3C84_1099530 [compost metagenome]